MDFSRVSDLNISKDQRKKHRPYYICNLQFQSAFIHEANSQILSLGSGHQSTPSSGASPFSTMGEITVDQKAGWT